MPFQDDGQFLPVRIPHVTEPLVDGNRVADPSFNLANEEGAVGGQGATAHDAQNQGNDIRAFQTETCEIFRILSGRDEALKRRTELLSNRLSGVDELCQRLIT